MYCLNDLIIHNSKPVVLPHLLQSRWLCGIPLLLRSIVLCKVSFRAYYYGTSNFCMQFEPTPHFVLRVIKRMGKPWRGLWICAKLLCYSLFLSFLIGLKAKWVLRECYFKEWVLGHKGLATTAFHLFYEGYPLPKKGSQNGLKHSAQISCWATKQEINLVWRKLRGTRRSGIKTIF